MSKVLRNLPSVNELLESPPLRSLLKRVNPTVVASSVRKFLDDFRGQVQSTAAGLPTPRELAETIATWITAAEQPGLVPAINATGVLLHPGLGRAPLAELALLAVRETGQDYCNLELDLATGDSSTRMAAVQSLLARLTGAESAVVVNNNAGATLLSLAALAAGKEVIVSRGQLVEIGGSYRLPEVMQASGAMLREVGTTNTTRLADYAAAIGDRTAALLRVHTSNYAVVGSAAQPALSELVALGRKQQLVVIDDLGSGALLDLTKYGITGEPVVSESIKAGADLVLFCGDKLLGGPQCGLAVGRRSLVQKISQHPWMRVLQPSKLTLAALAATLRLYEDPPLAERSVPILSLLATPLENLKQRAERIAPQLTATGLVRAEPLPSQASLSGEAVPAQSIKSWSIALAPVQGTASDLAAKLRFLNPAIVGRIEGERLLLDLRCVFPRQDLQLVAALELMASPQQTSAAELEVQI